MWTRYSDDQRAAAMAAYKANGNNLRKTARETGIPKGTLEYWARGDDANPVSDELQTNKNTELVDDLFLLAQALVKSALVKAEAEDGNVQQVTTSLGIVIDKINILMGEATSRVDLNVRNLPDLPATTISDILTD